MSRYAFEPRQSAANTATAPETLHDRSSCINSRRRLYLGRAGNSGRRLSILSDENEVLVVWKTSWVQKRSLIADCPAMRRWNETTKWASCDECCEASLQIVVPVEPGSRMATDFAVARAMQDRTSKYWKMARQAGEHRAEADGCCKAGKPNRSESGRAACTEN